MAETIFEIDVEFTSDWHIGIGAGRHGAVDRSIVTDADGLPCVPAKSAIGVLRDAAEIVASALDGPSPVGWTQWVDAIFGSQPAAPSNPIVAPRPAALIAEPLRLPTADRAYFTAVPVDVTGRRAVTRADLVRATTVMRSGLSIDTDTGTVREDGFRVEQRARAGLSVTGTWSIVHPDGQDMFPARLLLLAAARIVTSIGGKRRRGAGSAVVTLRGLGNLAEAKARFGVGRPPVPWAAVPAVGEEPKATARIVQRPKLRHSHDVLITVKRPVVADTGLWGNIVRTSTFIPAAMLLPVIRPGLTDPSLATLVRADAIVITDATVQVNGSRGLPWPRALTQSKDAPRNDRLYVNTSAWHNENGRLRPKASRYVTADCKTWCDVDVVQGAHAVIDDIAQRPTSSTGGLFVYEGIAPGTVLQASIFLPEGTELAAEQIATECRIGRSGKDDYGLVEIRIVEAKRDAPPRMDIPAGATFPVWLVSDVLLCNGFGGPDTRPVALAAALAKALGVPGALNVVTPGAIESDDGSTQVRETALVTVSRRQTWQTSWGLPRPSLTGIAAGSVIVCDCTEPLTGEAISRIQAEGLGVRTAEGFGRLLINPPALRCGSLEIQPSVTVFEETEAAVSGHVHPGSVIQNHVVVAAWRSVIVRRATAAAYHDYVPKGLAAAQLGSLRAIAAGLSGEGGLEAATAWIDRVRTGRTGADWGLDYVNRIQNLLLHDPGADDHPVWPLLFGYLPDDLVEPRRGLAIYAVQMFLGEAVRAASRNAVT